MSAWSNDELHRIAAADDLHIAPFREDGTTFGTPTWIWSVAVDDALYVRADNGTRSRWHQAAMKQKAGRITAALLILMSAFASAAAVDATISSERTHQPTRLDTITITRSETRPPSEGPAQYFTGAARIDPLFAANEPSRANGASVTFEPGARTVWHTHPLGQTLIVTAGTGRVASWGEPAQEIGPGDVVWIPPGQKHWHGASPTTRLTHIAIQEHVAGKNVEWLEPVTDEQYGK